MKNNKNVYLYLLFWTIAIIGLMQILIFFIGLIKFLIFKKTILWARGLIILVMGIVLFLIGKKYAKKYAS